MSPISACSAPADAIDELSERERELLGLMAAGYSNSGICRTLFLSPKTVETHVRSIFMKLGLPPSGGSHRRVVAVLMFLESTGAIARPVADWDDARRLGVAA
jgi:DNA-binding NarL/FixJ family response regulator